MMKMNDKEMHAAIKAALTELTTKEMSDLFMLGGRLDLDFETRQAKLLPGARTKAHPHPTVVLDPEAPSYPISALKMWLPPFPGAKAIKKRPLTHKGWDAMFALARVEYAKNIEIWIQHLRELEDGAISMLKSRAPNTEAA